MHTYSYIQLLISGYAEFARIYPPSTVCVKYYIHKVLLDMKEFPESRLHSTIKYSGFVAPRLILILENHMCKYFKTLRIPEYVKYLLLLFKKYEFLIF